MSDFEALKSGFQYRLVPPGIHHPLTRITPWRTDRHFQISDRPVFQLIHPSVNRHALDAPPFPILLDNIALAQILDLLHDVLLDEQVERRRAVGCEERPGEGGAWAEEALERGASGNGGKAGDVERRVAADAVGVALVSQPCSREGRYGR